MEKVKEIVPDILVLEVEEPADEMSIRRIGFYKRCGLQLCEKDYFSLHTEKEGKECRSN